MAVAASVVVAVVVEVAAAEVVVVVVIVAVSVVQNRLKTSGLNQDHTINLRMFISHFFVFGRCSR